MFEHPYQKILWGSIAVMVVSVIAMVKLVNQYENENKEIQNKDACNNSALNQAYLAAPADGMACTMWDGMLCRSGVAVNGNCDVKPSRLMQVLILVFVSSIVGMIYGLYKKMNKDKSE